MEYAAVPRPLASGLKPMGDPRRDPPRRCNLLGTNEDRKMAKKRPEFSHHIRNEGDVIIAELRGHLDGHAAIRPKPEIDKLLNGSPRFIVFDCRQFSYTGLIGYTIVLTTARKLQRRKGRFAPCALAPDLNDIFVRAGMMNLDIPIFDSIDEALAANRTARK